MKRIVLGISVLLMLVSNGFAKKYSDAEYDRNINNSSGYMKQNIKCEKAASNYLKGGDIQECIKAVNLINKSNDPKAKEYLASETFNLAFMYDEGIKDKLKAYKYYMEAAKLGHINAQNNLRIMCKNNPWACK
jgi:TPR repeat protein